MDHLDVAHSILTDHSPCIADDVLSEGLARAIAAALQNAFDMGYRAAGGEVVDLRSDKRSRAPK